MHKQWDSGYQRCSSLPYQTPGNKASHAAAKVVVEFNPSYELVQGDIVCVISPYVATLLANFLRYLSDSDFNNNSEKAAAAFSELLLKSLFYQC